MKRAFLILLAALLLAAVLFTAAAADTITNITCTPQDNGTVRGDPQRADLTGEAG